MRLRNILIGVAVVGASFLGASFALQVLSPGPGAVQPPAVVEPPPLKQVSRTSTIVTPTAIALTAIRDVLEAAAPRNLSGKRDNPVSQLLSNADIGWTMSRGPLAVTGRPDAMAVSTVLNGTLHVTGQIAAQVGNLGGALGGILNQNLGQGLQNLTGKTIDQHADVRGNATILSRPVLAANWRIDPNLTAQVASRGLRLVGRRHQDRRGQRGEAVAGPPSQRTGRRPCRRACAPIRSWRPRRGANGRRCAARSRWARPVPGCRTSGSSFGRPGLLPDSRASMRPR